MRYASCQNKCTGCPNDQFFLVLNFYLLFVLPFVYFVSGKIVRKKKKRLADILIFENKSVTGLGGLGWGEMG